MHTLALIITDSACIGKQLSQIIQYTASLFVSMFRVAIFKFYVWGSSTAVAQAEFTSWHVRCKGSCSVQAMPFQKSHHATPVLVRPVAGPDRWLEPGWCLRLLTVLGFLLSIEQLNTNHPSSSRRALPTTGAVSICFLLYSFHDTL